MRILFVSHDFLPTHAAGTELYTAALAARLLERGHAVELFTTEKDIGREHLSLTRRDWDGLRVHELVNNLFYADFRETWDWPPAVLALERVLHEFRPEVVHFMHLLNLSVGCVEAVAGRGIPVFFTLHDFWLQCARFGQRIHADGSICHVIDFERCGSCLARLKWAQTPLERRAAGVVAAVHKATGIDLGGAARKAGGLLRAPSGAATHAVPDTALERAMAGAMARRDAELRARIVPAVERFFAPSRFLHDRFVEWGLPGEKLEVLPYGLELEPFRGFARERSAKTRVAFIGQLAPHKGPHLLLEAWAALPAELRTSATLTVHGPKDHHPEYVARLERLAAGAGAALPGRLERDRIRDALAVTDLLVVPSVWYENSPLSIHEALATKTPLLVSDLGGMAELVEEGRSGWRFRPGDARDLAAKLERILRAPARLLELDFAGAEVKDMRVSAAEMEERYRAALDARTSRS